MIPKVSNVSKQWPSSRQQHIQYNVTVYCGTAVSLRSPSSLLRLIQTWDQNVKLPSHLYNEFCVWKELFKWISRLRFNLLTNITDKKHDIKPSVHAIHFSAFWEYPLNPDSTPTAALWQWCDVFRGPTHEGDEFVLQLIVQTGDHHFHSVSDLSDPLVLRSPDSLHVPLLTQDITHVHTQYNTHTHRHTYKLAVNTRVSLNRHQFSTEINMCHLVDVSIFYDQRV